MNRPSRLGAAVLVAIGTVAALLYANFLLVWNHGGLVGADDVVSELEAPGQPYAAFLRTTDVVCAVLVVVLLPWVRAALPRGRWRDVVVGATGLFAVGATVAALVPTPCGPDVPCPHGAAQTWVHDASSVASDTALYVGVAAAWVATREAGPTWFRRAAWWLVWLGGVLSSAVFAVATVAGAPDEVIGVSQRVHILGISAWIVCLALLAARATRPARHRADHRHPDPDRREEPDRAHHL